MVGRASMKNIIEVINVTKKYDGFILDNINFTFQEGSIMGLIGPNVPRYILKV